MTITAHLRITQDDEVLVEDAVEYDEEQDNLWTTLLAWQVQRGVMARDIMHGPPPKAAPKLPREAWDEEARK